MSVTSKITFLQTCVPDYRIAVFDAVAERLSGLEVFSGDQFFSRDIRTNVADRSWYRHLVNRFFCGRAVLWQQGVIQATADADVLICEYNPRILSTWALLVVRRYQGKRTLLWGHIWGRGGNSGWTAWMRLVMCRFSDGLICYSESQAREVAARLRDRVPVFAAPNSCVRQLDCRPAVSKPQNVVYVGRLTKEKKPALLVRAFAHLAGRLPTGARLVIVGAGSERAVLEKIVLEAGIGDRVDLLGSITDLGRLREIYASALVAVSPGYVGLSAIQCMAFGVPMLVSRTENHSPEIEACVEGKTCTFFSTNDAHDLAHKLEAFYTQSIEWIAKRESIAKFTSQYYSIEQMADRFELAAQTVFEAKTSSGPIAIVWAQYGPYHFARLRALRSLEGGECFHGVEIASRTNIYGWDSRNPGQPLDTLCPGEMAESIGAGKSFFRAIRLFRRLRVRVVFVPSYWPESSLGVLIAAKLVGAATVMMNDSHRQTSQASGLRLKLKRRLVRLFDAALIGGCPQAEYFRDLGIPKEKIFDGYDAVDNSFFVEASARCRAEAPALRKQYALPERYFLNIGRMVEKKNLIVLLKAFARGITAGATFPRLVFVGSGPMELELRDSCVQLGLSFVDLRGRPNPKGNRPAEADVLFYGFRQADELPVFYSLATAFVLPSVREEWGLVVNEAMACALPVVVSETAGCAVDLVRSGKNGFQFDPVDVDGLAERLRWLGENPEEAAQMGEHSREIIAEWDVTRFARNAEKAAAVALGAIPQLVP